MVGIRKEVEGAEPAQLVSMAGEEGHIASERHRIAGHVDDLAGTDRPELVDDGLAGPRAGRIEHDGGGLEAAALERTSLAQDSLQVPVDPVGLRAGPDP